MPFVSVTRLRLRSPRFFPLFAWHTWTSLRQARAADGFLGGYLAGEPGRAYWTVTAWRDGAAMLAYRNTEAHRRAMPGLIAWCDEASVAHWDQPTADLPGGDGALARMVAEGRLSKVRHPSAEHAAGTLAPARRAPGQGLPIRPRTAPGRP